MNKFAIAILTAAVSLSGGAALAAETSQNSQNSQAGQDNNGTANQAADAGAVAPGAKQNLPPKGVDNSKINNSGINNSNTSSTPTAGSNGMSADEMDQNAQCKDGKCPNINKKVQTQQGGGDVNRKTDGTTQ
ncbi:homeobox protein YbgS [Mixta theicola]|uniref:Homeobox protein YbgS n=1 Tax=Mixta theicola TaxID=1458355 RepID=A0A2K1QF86_9GAMM|nr:YbgS-like family protein [Mixta theicola]PNS13685.1 homeobox protein YbgS [Mixta theicola]GLR10014.1 periplasmic protein [Mixta theicola]